MLQLIHEVGWRQFAISLLLACLVVAAVFVQAFYPAYWHDVMSVLPSSFLGWMSLWLLCGTFGLLITFGGRKVSCAVPKSIREVREVFSGIPIDSYMILIPLGRMLIGTLAILAGPITLLLAFALRDAKRRP